MLKFRISCAVHPEEVVVPAGIQLNFLTDGDVHELDVADLFCPIADVVSGHTFVIDLLEFDRIASRGA